MINIITAKIEHIEQVCALQIKLCEEDCPDYELPDLKILETGIIQSTLDGNYLIAMDQDKVVGVLRHQRLFSDWNAEIRVFIDGIFVLKEYRNRGICTELFQVLFSLFDGQVCDYQLGVHSGNTNAMKLYKKLGFTSENYELLTKWNNAILKNKD